MSQHAYDRLSFLDSSFLFAENRTNHMHVGGAELRRAAEPAVAAQRDATGAA